MREIKFRVWEKMGKNMHEVYGIEFSDLGINININKDSIFWDNIVERYELMQYTGLKDNNGKEIYDGDYIKGTINIEYKDFEGVIEWNNELQRFDVGNKDEVKSMARISDFEIIGNIYENPELLTNQKN